MERWKKVSLIIGPLLMCIGAIVAAILTNAPSTVVNVNNSLSTEVTLNISLPSYDTPKPTQTSTPRITASQALSPTITSSASASPPATGSINVRSKPFGAGISFDGISIDVVTPHMIPHVEPGKDHTIKLTLEGYEDWPKDGPKEVQVMAGETTSVHANLAPISGSINVTSEPEGAEIYLDNNPKEKTPRTITEVPTGPHTIKLTRGEYRDWSDDNVLVKAGETTPVHATLTSIPATTANLTLSSTATPPGASTECPEIKITNPKDGDTVHGDPVEVSGTAKNFTNDELSLWICVRSNDSWHIQKIHNKIDGEIWKNTNTWIGDFPGDLGKRYEVKVLVATKDADEKLKNRLNGCYIAKLPEGTKICDSITVVRG